MQFVSYFAEFFNDPELVTWANKNKLVYKEGEGEKTVMGVYKKFYKHQD